MKKTSSDNLTLTNDAKDANIFTEQEAVLQTHYFLRTKEVVADKA